MFRYKDCRSTSYPFCLSLFLFYISQLNAIHLRTSMPVRPLFSLSLSVQGITVRPPLRGQLTLILLQGSFPLRGPLLMGWDSTHLQTPILPFSLSCLLDRSSLSAQYIFSRSGLPKNVRNLNQGKVQFLIFSRWAWFDLCKRVGPSGPPSPPIKKGRYGQPLIPTWAGRPELELYLGGSESYF